MQFPETKPLLHIYDPVQAHQYYERTKKLKGRKKGKGDAAAKSVLSKVGSVPANRNKQREIAAKKQRLDGQISTLRDRLSKLNAELKKRMAAAKKGEAKARTAAKEAAKPDTAAEKREAAEKSKDWRAKNQQAVKNQNAQRSAKAKASSGDSKTKAGGSDSVEDLKTTIGKVRDQLTAAVARRRALG